MDTYSAGVKNVILHYNNYWPEYIELEWTKSTEALPAGTHTIQKVPHISATQYIIAKE